MILLGAVLFAAPTLDAYASGPSQCQGAELSRATLLRIVKDHVKDHGVDPAILDDTSRARFEYAAADCDYLARVTFIPERPGGFIIYRISRAKKIVDVLPGA